MPRARCTVRSIIIVLISEVGTGGLTLPVDVEPYGPGDSEYAAAQRLLRRAVQQLGPRFADYVVGDGAYATAPFLHTTEEVGLPAVARLKENLPLLAADVRARFDGQPPQTLFQEGDDRVEIWDADDFAPWETLDWPTVRVLRYRPHKRDGIIQAEWLTNFPISKLGSLSFYRMAKSRWEIENRGFNDGKNRYGMEHICHHQANSILIGWLLIALAMVIERLYRLRYLHRGDMASAPPSNCLTTLADSGLSQSARHRLKPGRADGCRDPLLFDIPITSRGDPHPPQPRRR